LRMDWVQADEPLKGPSRLLILTDRVAQERVDEQRLSTIGFAGQRLFPAFERVGGTRLCEACPPQPAQHLDVVWRVFRRLPEEPFGLDGERNAIAAPIPEIDKHDAASPPAFPFRHAPVATVVGLVKEQEPGRIERRGFAHGDGSALNSMIGLRRMWN